MRIRFFCGIILVILSGSCEQKEEVNSVAQYKKSMISNAVNRIKEDLAINSSIRNTHPLCGEGDFYALGTLAVNFQKQLIFHPKDSVAGGKLILVSSDSHEDSIYSKYDDFLRLKPVVNSVFWISFKGHYLDSLPTIHMYDMKKVFVHSITYHDSDSINAAFEVNEKNSHGLDLAE